MICSERKGLGPGSTPQEAFRHRAVSLGPAVQFLCRGAAGLRVHSIFPSTVNLRLQGAAFLLALTGPGGTGFPHAVALEHPGDFTAWGLAPGSPGRLEAGSIRLMVEARKVIIDLTHALQPPARGIARVGGAADARRACEVRLAEIQANLGCDLRLDALEGAAPPPTALGQALRLAALALGASAQDLARRAPAPDRAAPLRRAVAALVGLGQGLTPSGDDFLCGFLAAARGRRPGPPRDGAGLPALLNRSVGDSLSATGDISASLMRIAIAGHWPVPLADLARALAGNRTAEALRCLEQLCALGRSSGADLATGFLFGLEILAGQAL